MTSIPMPWGGLPHSLDSLENDGMRDGLKLEWVQGYLEKVTHGGVVEDEEKGSSAKMRH